MPPPNELRGLGDAAFVAGNLAQALESRSQEYALGGALALGYWAEPRGTMDVDLTLFLTHQRPSEIVWVLQEIGCEVVVSEAVPSIQQHGFCRVMYQHVRVDVFVPLIPFYELAKARRRRVDLDGVSVIIWDAETLSVFKMMFFRRKDLADIEQILRSQGSSLDRIWIREQLAEIYGSRDARIAQWDELCAEIAI